jgi:SAM-dependent methyltransferase
LPVEKALLRAFAELVGEGATVVETGCGTGEVTRRLRDLRVRVVGTDLSLGMLRVARTQDPDAADGAVCWYVLQHVPDDDVDAALGELHRVVRPGGHVLLGFHSGTGSHLKTDGYGGNPMRVQVHRRTAAEVADRLRENGLRPTALVETPAADERSGAGACVLAVR